MHATVDRSEGGVTKWTDGLSREAGEAIVRDLLEFEGFRSRDRGRPGEERPFADYHQRQGDRARARRSVARAIGTQYPQGQRPPPGPPT
jgi:hypothetical protein